MFNSLKKTFESDNEGPNKTSKLNNDNDEEYKDKEKSSYIGNKTKVNKFKVPKNFFKKKFKYTIEEESDTNMILEQEYENVNKEKAPTNTINLRLLSTDAIIWKKSGIFLLEIYVNKNKKEEEEEYEDEDDNSNNSNNSNKTLEYLYRLTNNTKEFRQKIEIGDENDIKQNIVNYINQFKYKIKLLIIYLEKIEIEESENNSPKNEIIMDQTDKSKDFNNSGFSNSVFIDLFSSSQINIPFYVITQEYLYAKLFNKKLNYIFMNNDFLSDKVVKVLLFHKKISPNNSNNDLTNNDKNKNNEPIVVTTRGFLPEFKETKINIEGSTSSTLSLSSDEDYLDNSVIYTKNGIGIIQFKINNSI